MVGYSISDKGKKALASADGMKPMHILVLEITKRTSNISRDHLVELAVKCVDMCGSVDDAITALKTGMLVLDKTGTET